MRNITTYILSFIFALIPLYVAAADAPVTVTNIITTDEAWDGSSLPGYTSSKPLLLVNHFKIIPGGKTSVHLHPSNGAGYIISGELTMYATSDTNGSFDDQTKVKKAVLKAGEAWAENVNVWHYGENNGDDDVTFVVVFANEEGVPATLGQ